VTPRRILDTALVEERGLGAALAHGGIFTKLYGLLWQLDVLRPRALARLVQAVGTGRLDEACAVLVDKKSFRNIDVWSLFWSLSQASIAIADRGRTATHEPELNGAYMTLINEAIASFDGVVDGTNFSTIIGDHATLGNEARTGADFGLIIEMERVGEKRYLVTLLQAKRATSRRTSVHRAAGTSTQLGLLAATEMGAFLFYHAHGNPEGLGPTTSDARRIAKGDANSVDVVDEAVDFAAKTAVAAHQLFKAPTPHTIPGFGATDRRDDALRRLFDPRVPGLKVNDVLIARIGDHKLPPRAVADFKNDWRQAVDWHRGQVENARSIAEGTSQDEQEPPIKAW